MRYRATERRGATVVEGAFVYPVTFLLVLGLLIGSSGIFRYQEMANLSREAARYAAVHGTQYAKDANVTAPMPSDIYDAAIAPKIVSLDTTLLNYSITYNSSNAPYHTTIDANGNVTPVYNTVTVILTYQWIPEAYLGGITLTSTSVMPMSY
jgi:Flp pilus assembly protein TadG